MARHRRYSVEFKRRVAQEHLVDGVTLGALARHHDISRNLIRLWVEKYEAGEFDDDDVQADLLAHCKRRIAELERKVGLVMNEEFLRFAHHWGFVPRSCRPYRARTKGKVERPIRYLRDNFFYGRSFASDDDLDAQVAHWLEGTANLRRHATTGERPVDRFERDERAALLPLANRPYRRLGALQAVQPRRLPVSVAVERRALSVYTEILK